MQLPEYPATPWLMRIASMVIALLAAGLIVWLVFTFGYYASGLAALDEAKRQEQLRKQEPISLEFGDPNRDPDADPNADASRGPN